MDNNELNDKHIGRKAVQLRGFHSGIVGVIERADRGVNKYQLRYWSDDVEGIRSLHDIEFYEEGNV